MYDSPRIGTFFKSIDATKIKHKMVTLTNLEKRHKENAINNPQINIKLFSNSFHDFPIYTKKADP